MKKREKMKSIIFVLFVCFITGVLCDLPFEEKKGEYVRTVEFSDNACVLIGGSNYSKCKKGNDISYPCIDFPEISGQHLIRFESFEDAVEKCPFDPLVVEVIGDFEIASLEYVVSFSKPTSGFMFRGVYQKLYTSSQDLSLIPSHFIYHGTISFNMTNIISDDPVYLFTDFKHV